MGEMSHTIRCTQFIQQRYQDSSLVESSIHNCRALVSIVSFLYWIQCKKTGQAPAYWMSQVNVGELVNQNRCYDRVNTNNQWTVFWHMYFLPPWLFIVINMWILCLFFTPLYFAFLPTKDQLFKASFQSLAAKLSLLSGSWKGHWATKH